jgi:hypothetical protein
MGTQHHSWQPPASPGAIHSPEHFVPGVVTISLWHLRTLARHHGPVPYQAIEHNRKPKTFVWTADPNRIIEKINRGHQVLASDH